jgi:putative DNA primase/helicase
MLSARRVREHQFEFKPQFKMFMNTNYLPRIEDPTLFSSGRVRVITFDRHFDEDEQDKNLAARLKRPENLPGVMKWLVDGYFMYKDEGLKPPRCVILATREYEEASDMYANFIDSVLIKEDVAIIPAGSAYAVFERWCKEEQYPHVKKKEFFAELRKRGLIKDTGTVEGKTKRNVITGYRIDQGAFKASAL